MSRLTNFIDQADRFHKQARAIVTLIGTTRGEPVEGQTIIWACAAAEDLLDQLGVERREIEGIAQQSIDTISSPAPAATDGTGARIPEDMRSVDFISFPACIEAAEKVYRRSARGGLEYAGMVTNETGVTYMEAEAICAMLRIGGHKDWRVPMLDEMQKLHRIAKCEGLFWTSTPADSEAFTTTIDVDPDGYIAPCEKVSGCFLLPVRSIAGKAVRS